MYTLKIHKCYSWYLSSLFCSYFIVSFNLKGNLKGNLLFLYIWKWDRFLVLKISRFWLLSKKKKAVGGVGISDSSGLAPLHLWDSVFPSVKWAPNYPSHLQQIFFLKTSPQSTLLLHAYLCSFWHIFIVCLCSDGHCSCSRWCSRDKTGKGFRPPEVSISRRETDTELNQ